MKATFYIITRMDSDPDVMWMLEPTWGSWQDMEFFRNDSTKSKFSRSIDPLTAFFINEDAAYDYLYQQTELAQGNLDRGKGYEDSDKYRIDKVALEKLNCARVESVEVDFSMMGE